MTTSERCGPGRQAHEAARTQQLGEGAPVPLDAGVGKVHAVGVDVLAEKGDFFHSLLDKRPYFRQDVAGATIEFFASQMRDDAKRARVIASD